MCDTVWASGPHGSIFAKNSDRPPTEVQLVVAHDRRPPGPALRTQYLSIPDTGATATVLARPTWLWGAEHGFNEYGVAIGNEEIYTVVDASAAPPALIGMDLVRLGLERGRSAEEALEVVTGLLGRFGQGGVANTYGEAYFSSFLIADAAGAFVLETAGSTWAARPLAGAGAISNRLSIGTDWTLASHDVAAGDDFDAWRRTTEPTGHADRRLDASRSFLAAHPRGPGPRQVVAHLRDHGHGPWGSPGARDAPQPLPTEVLADFTGVTVCMHVRDFMATTSSMVVELPGDAPGARRAWVATGSPCVSVFVPVLMGPGPQAAVPETLGDERFWHDQAALRDRAERDPAALAPIRAVLDPIEAELWDEADALDGDPRRFAEATGRWGSRVAAAAAALAGRTEGR